LPDGRLAGALARGLVAAGVDVIDIGMVTRPMLYFAANTLCRGGIQVTGSHNPRDWRCQGGKLGPHAASQKIEVLR